MKGITFHSKGAKGEVFIYDDIGGFWSDITAKTFTDELKALGKITDLDVRINSGGGSVFDGVAIYNAIKRHPAKVTVHIDGLAASIASVVAMAGDTIRMADNAFLMIHDPWTMTTGTADDLRDMANTLDKVAGSLTDVYVDKTGLDKDQVIAMMADETWMTSTEARDLGFVDEVTEEMAIAAHCDLSRFRNAPDRLTEIIEPERPEPSADIKTINARMAQTLRERNL